MPTIAIYAIVAAVLFAGGLGTGVKLTSDHYKALELAAQKQVVADIKAEVKHENDASQHLEERKDEQRVVYQTITTTADRIVEKPVYRDLCFDDDRVRAANDASARPATAPAHPPPAVPSSHPSPRQHPPRRAHPL